MSISRLPDWRRPSCNSNCWRKPVLIIGERGKQIIEWHDVDAHESAARGENPLAVIETGPLVIDRRLCRVTLDGKHVHLTGTEYAILLVLAEQAGTICSHKRVLDAVWGPGWTADSHILRVNLARLRRKLGGSRGMLETHLQFGLLLHALPPGDPAPPPCPPVPLAQAPDAPYVRQAPRRKQVIADLKRAPGKRRSIVQLAIALYGADFHLYRKYLRMVIRHAQSDIPTLHMTVTDGPERGWVWLEGEQP